MDANDLLSHIRSGEGLMTEFNRCGGEPERDVYETICSFANRQGGNAFLGVTDGGDIIGVPQGPCGTSSAPSSTRSAIMSCSTSPPLLRPRSSRWTGAL